MRFPKSVPSLWGEEVGVVYLVYDAFPAVSVDPCSNRNSADLFHGFLRAQILWTYEKNYAANELEGVP